MNRKQLTEIVKFQSTHPHGVRQDSINPLTGQSYVSIHAPTRGATGNSRRHLWQFKFQSTHPHGVRHHLNSLLTYKRISFNPRTHTGCDPALRLHHRSISKVSIHAPTRGATKSGAGCRFNYKVSIHAPTRGATVCKVTYYKSIN